MAYLVDDSEKNLISLFMSRLKKDLRGKAKMDMPLMMVAAYRSACAREMIALTGKRLSMFQSYKSPNSLVVHIPPAAKGLPPTAASKEGDSATQVPIRRLTPEKVEEYRRKNLCFKCDEPFTPGHKCRNKSLMMIESEEQEELSEEEEEILLEPKSSQKGKELEISLHAMEGSSVVTVGF